MRFSYLILLFVVAFAQQAAVATFASMFSGSSMGLAAFQQQLPAVFLMVQNQLPTKACQNEFGKFEAVVKDGTILKLFSSPESANKLMCARMSKRCVQELGVVLTNMAGEEIVKNNLVEAFGAGADVNNPKYQIPTLMGNYYDFACSAAAAAQ